MDQKIEVTNYTKDGEGCPEYVVEGNLVGLPCGGTVKGVGIDITWQDGPMKSKENENLPQNGAFVEGVIKAAISRLQFYQLSKFQCRENSIALTHLETALLWLNKRTADREARGVEGTHQL